MKGDLKSLAEIPKDILSLHHVLACWRREFLCISIWRSAALPFTMFPFSFPKLYAHLYSSGSSRDENLKALEETT